MTRQELVAKLENIFADAERSHLFGSTEIEWRNGRPTIIREIKTNRLDGEYPQNANEHRK
jgi:hypothetical protein